MGAVRLLPAGQEAVEAAEDRLIVVASALLQLQYAQEGLGVVAARGCRPPATPGLSGGVTFILNGWSR